jgi:DNA-binding transcriptional MerR regulator
VIAIEYTIKKLANLVGVSTRTLRFYDEIGLLKPHRINASGYRIYGQQEIDLLQQILFYRELGVPLEQIQSILYSPAFDKKQALQEHYQNLVAKQKQLELLIQNVKKTIAAQEGKITMTDKEKFEGFKHRLIADNEEKYGEEIRAKYGADAVDNTNQKLKNMTEAEYEEVTQIEKKMIQLLIEAFASGDPASEKAQEAAQLHKKWLSYYWNEYNKEAHMGLAEMYVADDRFKQYYNKYQAGLTEFLRDAIQVFTS